MKPTCHYDPDTGWLSAEHRSTCTGGTCRGCRPCSEGHCGMRKRCAHHVDHDAGIFTCPSCIGRTRKDLAAVVELYALDMPAEAAEKGVDSEAFHLAGPAANPAVVAEYREAAEWLRGWCTVRPRPELHPYALLGKWDMALREDYGPPTRLLVTVERAADYLEGLLAGDFPHTRAFEEFAREIRECRDHLEEVLHDSRKPEEGARCPECGKGGPRLRKRYAEGKDEKTRRGDRDTWHCPREAAHWWSDFDYRTRVADVYADHAPALTADQIAARWGITQEAIRKAAQRGKLTKVDVIKGKQTYAAEDARRLWAVRGDTPRTLVAE